MGNNAPILLFVYKRLETLERCVEALKNNELSSRSDLFIFSDAAKKKEDEQHIKAVRNYIKEITGFKTINLVFAEKNKGLANSIIEGVSKVFADYDYDNVIVLEDDLICSPLFLKYMNHALFFYKNMEKVYSISGYSYDFVIPDNYPFDSYMALRGCSWGWATWKDRWMEVEWNIDNYTRINDRSFIESFNKMGTDLYPMLIKQKNGKIDSWAVRWYYNQCIQEKNTVYPVLSLIQNEGFDELATHTNVFNRYKTKLVDSDKQSFNFNQTIEIDKYFQSKIERKFSILTRVFQGRFMTFLKHIGLIK